MKNCLTGAALQRTVFDLPGKKSKIENLRKETESPDFWKDQEKAKSVQKEIAELAGNEKNKSLTIVPISVYNKNRKIKIEIALVKGKKKFDKRRALEKRETDRSIRREMKRGE